MLAPLDKSTALAVLQDGEVDVQGQFLSGSNYTFMSKVSHQGTELVAVYKPVRGEQPLWDFPSGSLSKREVAAFVVSEGLGWDLVPPTLYRRKLPLGPGSLQQYIEHDPEYHYFNFEEQDRQRLRPVVVFDLIINNADRKGSHVIKDARDHLWLIDHGVCFHEEDKVRTVIWDFAGRDIPNELIEGMRRFITTLEKREELYFQLNELISPLEIAAMLSRTRHLIESCRFPHPGGSHRPYPWPPV